MSQLRERAVLHCGGLQGNCVFVFRLGCFREREIREGVGESTFKFRNDFTCAKRIVRMGSECKLLFDYFFPGNYFYAVCFAQYKHEREGIKKFFGI